jgi:hypothetical protein
MIHYISVIIFHNLLLYNSLIKILYNSLIKKYYILCFTNLLYYDQQFIII